MNCFYHPERPAVGQCKDCGKFLCQECSSKYKPILCDDCYQDRIIANKRDDIEWAKNALKIYKKNRRTSLVFAVIVFIDVFLFLGMENNGDFAGLIVLLLVSLILAAFIFFAVFGLRTRNDIEYLGDRAGGTSFFVNAMRGLPRFIKWQNIVKEANEILKQNN